MLSGYGGHFSVGGWGARKCQRLFEAIGKKHNEPTKLLIPKCGSSYDFRPIKTRLFNSMVGLQTNFAHAVLKKEIFHYINISLIPVLTNAVK